MGLTVIKYGEFETSHFLGVEIEEGPYWGTLTGAESASFNSVWKPLSSFLGESPEYRLTIFESKQAAEEASKHYSNANTKYRTYHFVPIEELFKFVD